ncbi:MULTISPECIES: hypothetical protein [unclassified Geodermatophilus]|uniref:hypothetical protein n=1 Tax=unclassified Geodermatophilus TaxID=2637632 RepID=UPI003EEB0568
MTTIASPSDRFVVLDSLIVRALAELRAARRPCRRMSDRELLDSRRRAEADLNALLEYRHAARQRAVRSAADDAPTR